MAAAAPAVAVAAAAEVVLMEARPAEVAALRAGPGRAALGGEAGAAQRAPS